MAVRAAKNDLEVRKANMINENRKFSKVKLCVKDSVELQPPCPRLPFEETAAVTFVGTLLWSR